MWEALSASSYWRNSISKPDEKAPKDFLWLQSSAVFHLLLAANQTLLPKD